jgi:hypothetical protein
MNPADPQMMMVCLIFCLGCQPPLKSNIDIGYDSGDDVADVVGEPFLTVESSGNLELPMLATTPNMGQGACMALEDAVVLAQCLHTIDAFKAYEMERVRRANKVVTRSWHIGKMLQLENSFLCWLRNTILLKSSLEKSIERMAWLLDKDFTFEADVHSNIDA